MSDYTQEQYLSDLYNAAMPHLGDDVRFKAFYDRLGEGPAKDIQYPEKRMDWVQPSPASSIIELGCSSGYNIVEWVTRDPECSVAGVDISRSAVRETVRRISKLPPRARDRVSVFESSIEDSPGIVVGTFSDVVLTEVLEHVQDPRPVLAVAWGFVRTGGTLWITVPSRRWGNYSNVRGIRSATLASMLQDVGVDVAEIVEAEEVMHEGERLTRVRVVKQQS